MVIDLKKGILKLWIYFQIKLRIYKINSSDLF